MKIKKSSILFLLIIAVFATLALLKLNSVLNANNLKANINDYEHIETLRTYNVGDVVSFDPVNYRICEDASDTCMDFIVINKTGDSYNLIYLGKDENMKWTVQNPSDILNAYTENWSSNLTVNDSYKYVVSENYKYNFNKARILTKDEYDLLSEDVKKIVVGDVSGPRYYHLVINPKYTEEENPSLDLTTSEFGFIGQAGQFGTEYIQFFPFTANEQGSMVNTAYIRPVINFDMNNVGNNTKTKYIVNFRQFSLYDTIDFDPVNYRFCDDDYESDTCYSWVVINKSGNEYDLYAKTIIPSMKWTTANPVDVIESYTQSWSDKLKLNSKYDIKVNDNYGYYFKGKKARMLTKEEYNSEGIEKIVQRNILVPVINRESQYISFSRVDTQYTTYNKSAQNYNLVDIYSFSLNASGSYDDKAYIAPVIHINMEDGIDNSEEKERKKYTCRRATKNITLGQINTKGELKSGDVFDCDVDGKGYTERFYYVADLEENNDYGVLIYSHNLRNGEIYDFIGYHDDDVGQDYSNFEYDSENRPDINGPKTAISQLPTKQQWNTRLYSETRNLRDTNNILRVSNFNYDNRAARLLTYKEFLTTCGYDYREIYDSYIEFPLTDKCLYLTDNIYSHGSDKDTEVLQQKGLPYMTKMNKLPFAFWLETPFVSSHLDENQQPVFESYNSALIVFGSYQGEEKLMISSAIDESDKGIKPVIEVKKTSIDYVDYVNVTYNDEDRITVKEIPKGSKTDAIDSKGKTNYTFKYWSLSKTGEEFDFNTVINTDTTLYAVYELDSYTISYDLDEGTLEIENPTSYTPLSNDITLNNPTKDHYTFIGWTGSNGDVPQTSVTIVSGSTGNKSYKANYEINKYDVEFYDDEELLDTQKIEHGKKIEKDVIPKSEKVGYKFIGWREKESTENFDLDTVITKSYKLYATFEKIECTLSLKSNMYKIDEEKKEINNVPENEEIEVIKSNLIIEGTLKEITKEYVTITCDDKTKTYKINRIWIPKTGNIVARGSIIFGYIGVVLILLFVIGKQVDINKRLRRRL